MIEELKVVNSLDSDVNEKRLKKLVSRVPSVGKKDHVQTSKRREEFENQLESLEKGQWWRSQIQYLDS